MKLRFRIYQRDQVEVMLELEGQLLHEQVHVLVNLKPVQVVGVALGENQVIVVFSFIEFDNRICISKF